MMRRLLFAAIALLAIGCSDSQEDNVVGASCTQNAECRFQCEPPSNDFPGGFCTVPCNSDSQCPHLTVCIEKAGNVCVFTCNDILDCAFLGAGWRCIAKDHVGGGKVNVCVGE